MSGEQLEPGTLLNDRYRILRVIGHGGMGTVYQAEHVRLDTILAVKEVRAPQLTVPDAQSLLEQCEHEARFLVRLHHPNLPQVTDAFLENDRFFMVMEYIEGVTLESRQGHAGPNGLPVPTVIEWALQIADVLAYLHSQSPPVIFRDLKPSNVMIQEDGRVRLIDFGIARRFQPGATKDTKLLGSVGYSPPEQFGRHQSDTRTDIYAFGATLHNLLTGKDPSHTPFKFLAICTLNPAVPGPLSRLIDSCLRLDADARPQSIHEIAMELLTIRDALPASDGDAPGATVESGAAEAENASPSSAKIILTNTTLRNSGKVPRGSQRVGSGSVDSSSLGSKRPGPPSAGGELAALGATEVPAMTTPRIVGGESRREGQKRSLWFGGIAAVVAVSALTLWMTRASNLRPRPTAGLGQAIQAAPGPTVTDSTPSPPPSGMTVTAPGMTPSESGVAPIASQDRSVSFDSVAVKGPIQDNQGRMAMRIDASGTAQGQPGDEIVIAAFFYDDQNSEVISQLPQTPYSSKDGKLSVATTLTLSSIHQTFDLQLDLPLVAFPANLTEGVQFHCVAFFGDQRIGESKTYTPVPSTLFALPTDSQQRAPTSAAPATGGSASAVPRRSTTFGSAPAHE